MNEATRANENAASASFQVTMTPPAPACRPRRASTRIAQEVNCSSRVDKVTCSHRARTTSTTLDRKSRTFPVRSTDRPCARRRVSGLTSRSAQRPTVRAPRSLRSTTVNATAATPMARTPMAAISR
jgi:hypothetical protein